MTTFTSEDRIAAAAQGDELPIKPFIVVKLKTNYGSQIIYPICEKAKIFCRLLGQQTLTPLNIKFIKELGYAIQVEPSEPRSL